MKRWLLFSMVLFIPATVLGRFYARNLTYSGRDWSVFRMHQLSCEVEVQGLFYRSTITFELGLERTNYNSPPPGSYEVSWDFTFDEEAVFTDCWIKGALESEFTRAEIIDLSQAEDNYKIQPLSTPRLLLRQRSSREWDGTLRESLQMSFSPLTLSRRPVIRISYLLPVRPAYAARRLMFPFDEMAVRTPCNIAFTLIDHDVEDQAPRFISAHPGQMRWQRTGERWSTVLPDRTAFQRLVLALAPENPQRRYLRISGDAGTRFYQLCLAPPLLPADIAPKKILLAVDLCGDNSNTKRGDLIAALEQAVSLSASENDAVALLNSGFTPQFYQREFAPVSAANIKALFNWLRAQPAPKLNTLPHLLRQGVALFNEKQYDGEIWLLTDANTHSDPPATAMEIISQTLAAAENSLTFRILNADASGWPYLYINQQVYFGNDYLYENLARLSRGSHIILRDQPVYNLLDAMLDGIAPSVASVEIDPQPQGGLCYSRYPLNRGRVNFPSTLPYMEIGLFDGIDPFQTRFYGLVSGELFARDLELAAEIDEGANLQHSAATYWTFCYVRDLLLEPQSFETIEYIEQISVRERLLTPYSGFIVPGPDGVLAFMKLDDEVVTAVQEPEPEQTLDAEYTAAAFPNPFNACTTISIPWDVRGEVEIVIVNSLGQIIRRSRPLAQGEIRYRWDGLTGSGLQAASGIYFVVVRAGERTATIKITLIR